MLVVPLSPVPSQTVSVVLAQQSCRISVYAKTTGLFLDLYVNDALIIAGVIGLNTVLIVRDQYLGFAGDLAFFDLQGSADPVYGGLGTRYILGYIAVGEFWT